MLHVCCLQASVTWQIVAAPAGYEAGQVVITPHSSSAGAAWASFAGAPAGKYVLAITASDGQLHRTHNVTVNHASWPHAVAILSPRENPLPGEWLKASLSQFVCYMQGDVHESNVHNKEVMLHQHGVVF